jgi:hypothetical protein
MPRGISFNLRDFIDDSVNAPPPTSLPDTSLPKKDKSMDPDNVNLGEANKAIKNAGDLSKNAQTQAKDGSNNMARKTSDGTLGNNVPDPQNTKAPLPSLEADAITQMKDKQAQLDSDSGVDQSDPPVGAEDHIDKETSAAKKGYSDRIKEIIKKKAMAAISEQLNGPPDKEGMPNSGPPDANRPKVNTPELGVKPVESPRQDTVKPEGGASHTPPPRRNISRPPSINFKPPSIPKYRR